jgi:DNA-binding CsgD family transcriptional regulator
MCAEEPASAAGRLRVQIHASDPIRRGGLQALLRSLGNEVVQTAPEVILADLGPGDRLPSAAGCPVLALADVVPAERADEPAGLLRRHVSARQLDGALRAVAAGLIVRDPDAAEGFAEAAEAAHHQLLTPREVEILTLVGQGFGNKAIARQLGISTHTVKFHLETVFTKLAATTRAEAVVKGLRAGAITM